MGANRAGSRGRGRGALVLAVAVVLGGLALVPAPARATAGAEAPSPARLETFELPSDLVDPASAGGRLEDRRRAPKVHVLLPAGYVDAPDRDYPVLWLLHGANGGTDTWLPDILEEASGFPGIVVMPDGGVFGMYVDWWNGGRREGPAWASYHLDVLRQTIEDRYNIRPGRRWHAIGGISMGGQGALRYAALLPGYFGSVAAFSAAMPDTQAVEFQGGLNLVDAMNGPVGASYETIYGPAQAPYAEGNSPRALVGNLAHTRIYLTSGWGIACTQDPVNVGGLVLDTITEAVLHLQQAPFTVAARKAGADVTAVTTCGVHTYGVWDRAIPAAFEWGFFEELPEQPDRWTYRTIAAHGEMWGLRFVFAEPPSSVVDFARTGTTLTGRGQGSIRIDGPDGCLLELTLPFRQRLPAACLAAG